MADWQDAVDDPAVAWIKRLWQRGEQPGVIRLAQTRDIARRLTGLGAPPLADEVARRYVTAMAQQQQMPPIVYAEPQPVMADRMSDSHVQSEIVLPLPVVTSQPIASHPAIPLSTVSPSLPVVNVSTTRQTQSQLAHSRPQPIPAPSTSVVPAAHPSLSVTAMPQVQNPPPAAAPTSHLPHATAAQHMMTGAADMPIAPPSLPLLVVRPQLSGQTQAQSVTRSAAIPVLPKPVNQVSTSPARPVVKTASPPAAAIPQSPPPSTMLPSPRMREAAAAEHSPVLPFKPVGITPVTSPAAQLNRDETPLPVVREQFIAPLLPTTTGLNQPLPLAQPPAPSVGNASHVVQRKPHTGVAHNPAPSRQPSPAPNRIIRADSVIQRAPLKNKPAAPSKKDNQTSDEDSDTAPAIDMDELVDRVHRQFLRRLTVEGERRGRTSWP